jgi:hypothetical protein
MCSSFGYYSQIVIHRFPKFIASDSENGRIQSRERMRPIMKEDTTDFYQRNNHIIYTSQLGFIFA